MPILQELRRRNVFRMAILYVVTAWLVLQVADVLFDALELPPQWTRLVLALLVLGFPFAIVFSWIYEITPDGVKRDDGRGQPGGHRLDTAIVVLLGIAVIGMLADRFWPRDADVEATAEPTSEIIATASRNSIAVLPFADLSERQDQQYFTDGLTEELLNVLVPVEGLQVASRTSSFSYRDSSVPIPKIAEELKVAHILEGSVRKDGDRIRITAQLIETASDRHLWSENFDREFKDIFTIQDEIATAIVDALSAELGLSDVPSVSVESITENLDAYQLYLEARELFIRRTRLGESIRKFHQAIELDPQFARAWEGLAAVEAIADDWLWGLREDDIDHLPLAEEAALTALELDSELSMPYAVLGQVYAKHYRDQVQSLAYLDAALEKDPKNLSALLWRGTMLKYAGYIDEAIESLQQCLDIDPTSTICSDYLAEALLYRGDIDQAIDLHNISIERAFAATAPSFVSYHVRNGNRGLALMIASNKMGGQDAPVIEWIRAIESPNADHSAGLARLNDWVRERDFRFGLPPQMLFTFGAHEQMLEIGEMQRRMLFHPDAAAFRSTPQFKEIVRSWGFDRLWRERGFPPQCRAAGNDDFACD